MAGRLDGRVAVITGAASGIGRAAAELFAAEGARVLAVDVHAPVVLGEAGPAIHPLRVDICAVDAPDLIIAEVERRYGRLDVLFNNAGISQRTLLADMSDSDWDRIMEVNVRAAFRLTRRAVPLLAKSSAGRIIATASCAAKLSSGGLGAYDTSKAAVAVLMRSFAADLGHLGITANAIAPGPTRTAMISKHMENPELVAAWTKHTFLRRLAEPEEVARVALFFASDDSSNVTGQMLAVDGGFASSL